MSISTPTNVGPTTLTKVARVQEAHGDYMTAADTWRRVKSLTAAWNPHMAKQFDKEIARCTRAFTA